MISASLAADQAYHLPRQSVQWSATSDKLAVEIRICGSGKRLFVDDP